LEKDAEAEKKVPAGEQEGLKEEDPNAEEQKEETKDHKKYNLP